MAAIHDLLAQIQDEALRNRIEQEVDKLSKTKKFGLVFEEHLPECTPLYDMPIITGSNVMLRNSKEDKSLYVVVKIEDENAKCVKKENSKENITLALDDIVRVAEFGEPIYPYLKLIDLVCNAPESDLWHTLIEADNYHALQLLEYFYAGKVDCIYIDPPYNTGAKDWKYNNDYVDGNDTYRHSKWLSMIQKRLRIAKKLLNPNNSVLIVTIDEKEYLHLGCLLEELFPEGKIQMITAVINPKGRALRDALIELRSENIEGFREIVIFPGVEITVTGNLHLLGIFDPSVDEDRLNQILGKFDYADDAGRDDSKYTNKPLREVMQIINQNKGIAIPAHADKPCGLFSSTATIIKSAFSDTGILALEVTEPTVNNQLYTESRLNLTHVVGSDSHNTRTIADQFTWVKMGEANIEALKLALYDAEDGAIRSICLQVNPNDILGRTYIKELTIENGRYIGRATPYKISFSPWLTNLIGGRGTGKSSVLKFIRLLLDKEDELPDSLVKDFKDFASVPSKRGDLGMLVSKDDTKTKVIMEVVVDGIEHSLMWKDGVTFELISDTQEWKPAVALSERFPIQMFSQKQLYEMTSDPELLFKYLDEKWDSEGWRETVNQTQRDYYSVQRDIRTLKEKSFQKDGIEAQLHDVEAKIAVFETDRTREVLQEQNYLSNNKKLVRSVYCQYEQLIELVGEFGSLSAVETSIDLSDLDEDSRATVGHWVASMGAMRTELNEVFAKYSGQCASFDTFLSGLKLRELIDTNKAAMDQVIEELQASGVDGIDKYADLLELRKRYQEKISAIGDISSQLEACEEKAKQLNEALATLLIQRNRERNVIIKSWNEIGQLQVTLCPMANMERNAEGFREIIRKDTEFSSEILEEFEDDTPAKGLVAEIASETSLEKQMTTLAEIKNSIISANTDRFGRRFITYLNRLFEQHPESADEIAMWIPEDKFELAINIGTNGKSDYRKIDAGSPGQRTSAILSLIFAISNSPIIIDQPEDDLDTRNITNIVVNGIKEVKKNQQVILVTHNPNIVVNTNSEQIIQLDYLHGQICNACCGALQNHDIRDAICNVMEGGKDALKKRYYRIFKALEAN